MKLNFKDMNINVEETLNLTASESVLDSRYKYLFKANNDRCIK